MAEKYVLVSKQGMTEESGSPKMSEAVSLRLLGHLGNVHQSTEVYDRGGYAEQ